MIRRKRHLNSTHVSRRFRHIQLLIQIFNDSQSTITYLVKLYCLCSGIIFVVLGVHYFHLNQILGIFYMILSIYVAVTYIMIYDRGFCIPQRISRLKFHVTVMSFSVFQTKIFTTAEQFRESKEIAAIIQSFPPVGIHVGAFTMLQRVSTPEYLQFVTEKAMTILVSIR